MLVTYSQTNKIDIRYFHNIKNGFKLAKQLKGFINLPEI